MLKSSWRRKTRTLLTVAGITIGIAVVVALLLIADGRIVRDQAVADPYRQDLPKFKASALGQSLLQSEVPQPVQGLGLEPLLPQLRDVLARL